MSKVHSGSMRPIKGGKPKKGMWATVHAASATGIAMIKLYGSQSDEAKEKSAKESIALNQMLSCAPMLSKEGAFRISLPTGDRDFLADDNAARDVWITAITGPGGMAATSAFARQSSDGTELNRENALYSSVETFSWNVKIDATEAATPLGLPKKGICQVTPVNICLCDAKTSAVLVAWPLRYLRRYGTGDRHEFYFEAGRKCPTGAGFFNLRTEHNHEIGEKLDFFTKMLSQQFQDPASVTSSSPTASPRGSVAAQGSQLWSPGETGSLRGAAASPRYTGSSRASGGSPLSASGSSPMSLQRQSKLAQSPSRLGSSPGNLYDNADGATFTPPQSSVYDNADAAVLQRNQQPQHMAPPARQGSMASVYGTLSREDRVTRDHGGGAKTEEDYTYSLLNADQGSAVARAPAPVGAIQSIYHEPHMFANADYSAGADDSDPDRDADARATYGSPTDLGVSPRGMAPAGSRPYDTAVDDPAYNDDHNDDPTYASNSAVSYATAQGHRIGHTPSMVHYQSTTPLYLESDAGSESAYMAAEVRPGEEHYDLVAPMVAGLGLGSQQGRVDRRKSAEEMGYGEVSPTSDASRKFFN